jgi:hypothetical protein
MKIDRSLFLAVTVALSSVACSAASEAPASGAADITESGRPSSADACTLDADEAPSPIAEGVCDALADKAQRHDFLALTSIAEGHGALFEIQGCVPSETGELLAPPGKENCAQVVAETVFRKCRVFADQYRRSASRAAVQCLENLEDLVDLGSVRRCGVASLEKSCSDPGPVAAVCAKVEKARQAAGVSLSKFEVEQCPVLVGGLLPSARLELVDLAKRGDIFDIFQAVEEIGMPPTDRR